MTSPHLITSSGGSGAAVGGLALDGSNQGLWTPTNVLVPNLNADLLDGLDSSAFELAGSGSYVKLDGTNQALWTPTNVLVPNLNADLLDGLDSSAFELVGAGPYVKLDGTNQASWTPTATLVPNLNADLLDGKNTGTSGNTIPLLDGANTWGALQIFTKGISIPVVLPTDVPLYIQGAALQSAKYIDIRPSDATTNILSAVSGSTFPMQARVWIGDWFPDFVSNDLNGQPVANTLLIGRQFAFAGATVGTANIRTLYVGLNVADNVDSLFSYNAGNFIAGTAATATGSLLSPTLGLLGNRTRIYHRGSGTVTFATGMTSHIRTGTGAGAIGTAIYYDNDVATLNGGAITDLINFRIQTQTINNTQSTNWYGIKIGEMLGTANRFPIILEGANALFWRDTASKIHSPSVGNLRATANFEITGTTTLNTALTGIIKAAAGVISVASSADLVAAIGNAAADGTTKGVATFSGNDFNDDGSGLISLDYTNGQSASAVNKGYLTSADWSTFNSKVSPNTVVTFTSINLTADSNQIVLDSDDPSGFTTTLTDSATAARIITFPDVTGTLLTTNAAQTISATHIFSNATSALTLQSGSPTITYIDNAGPQNDDFTVGVNASSYTIRNTTDSRNDLVIGGTGAWTMGGPFGSAVITKAAHVSIQAVPAVLNEYLLQLYGPNGAGATPEWRMKIGGTEGFEGFLEIGRGAFGNAFDFAWDNIGNAIVGSGKGLLLQGLSYIGAIENLNTAIYTNTGTGLTISGLNFQLFQIASATKMDLTASQFWINENNDDFDVRMDGDTVDNVFFLDASTDSLNIGTATPATGVKLNVLGKTKNLFTSTSSGTDFGNWDDYRIVPGGASTFAVARNIDYLSTGSNNWNVGIALNTRVNLFHTGTLAQFNVLAFNVNAADGITNVLNAVDGAIAVTGPGIVNSLRIFRAEPISIFSGGVLNEVIAFFDEDMTNSSTPAADTWGYYGLSPKNYIKGDVYFGQTDGVEKIESSADNLMDYYAGTTHNFRIAGTVKMALTASLLDVSGTINTPGTTGNTYKWNANTAAPGTSIGVGIVNFYGSSATNFLGDPVDWMLVNINGTDRKVPCY